MIFLFVMKGDCNIMSYKQLFYDIELAYCVHKIDAHPYDQMEKLGYKVIAGVPQSLGPCWWFTVEHDVLSDIEKPSYLRSFKYNYNYWHNKCWETCDFFQKNPGCCSGGFNCANDKKKEL